ncbi:MAG: response regulator [Verrucomicrobiota bacterium]
MQTPRCPPRLLIVDDLDFVRGMLAELFAQAGYEVEEAGGAEEALALGQMVRWDGVVLDVDMPGLGGVELYARLVQLNGGRRLPVLFFTGRPHPALALSLREAPWARFVAKPCGGRQLVALMEQCLLAVREAASTPDG